MNQSLTYDEIMEALTLSIGIVNGTVLWHLQATFFHQKSMV
jgi:hypothetical protein